MFEGESSLDECPGRQCKSDHVRGLGRRQHCPLVVLIPECVAAVRIGDGRQVENDVEFISHPHLAEQQVRPGSSEVQVIPRLDAG